MTLTVDPAVLVHGYTVDDLDRFADQAVRRTRIMGGQVDADEARQEALSAISSLVFGSSDRPTRAELIDAGAQCIAHRAAVLVKDRGLRRTTGGGYEKAPRFHSYWAASVGADVVDDCRGAITFRINQVDWTEAIVERMALPQVLAVLTPGEYEAVLMLAKYRSAGDAADALGVNRTTLNQRLSTARRRMEAVWFDDETPPAKPAHKGDETRCRNGHSRALHGFVKANGNKGCRRCASAASLRYQGKNEPERDVPDELDDVLTFPTDCGSAPTGTRLTVQGWVVIGTTACWCGLDYGHDWPDKTAGAAHPPEKWAA